MRKRRMLFLFPRKGRTGLELPKVGACGWQGKSPHFRPEGSRLYFPPKPCVRHRPATSVLLEKGISILRSLDA